MRRRALRAKANFGSQCARKATLTKRLSPSTTTFPTARRGLGSPSAWVHRTPSPSSRPTVARLER
eukprot:3188221-Rhodomonas_salina.1